MYFNIKGPQCPSHLLTSNLPGKDLKGCPLCFIFPSPLTSNLAASSIGSTFNISQIDPLSMHWITALPYSKPSGASPLPWDTILLHALQGSM